MNMMAFAFFGSILCLLSILFVVVAINSISWLWGKGYLKTSLSLTALLLFYTSVLTVEFIKIIKP